MIPFAPLSCVLLNSSEFCGATRDVIYASGHYTVMPYIGWILVSSSANGEVRGEDAIIRLMTCEHARQENLHSKQSENTSSKDLQACRKPFLLQI